MIMFRLTDNSLESVKQKLELLRMSSLEEKFHDHLQTRSPQEPPRMHLVLQVRSRFLLISDLHNSFTRLYKKVRNSLTSVSDPYWSQYGSGFSF